MHEEAAGPDLVASCATSAAGARAGTKHGSKLIVSIVVFAQF